MATPRPSRFPKQPATAIACTTYATKANHTETLLFWHARVVACRGVALVT